MSKRVRLLAIAALLLPLGSAPAQAEGPPRLVPTPLFKWPLRIEAGYTRDDNINRAPAAGPKQADHVFSLGASTGTAFPITRRTRFLFTAQLEGDKLADATGLDRLSAGVGGELQLRAAGTFNAPTFGLFGRVMFDEYRSDLRSGHRRALGLSMRAPLTDRIELFGALARNERRAAHPVFDGSFLSARLNLDYSLGRRGSLYFGGEARRGDGVSSVWPGFENAVAAKAVVLDDAYPGTLYAYRYDARTWLWTLGYNWPLGPRSSVDFSLRHARSTPTQPLSGGTYAGAGAIRYTANQLSAAYLMRF